MKKLMAFLVFFSAIAEAQVSVQESDSSNKIRIFSREVNFNFFNLASLEADKAEGGGRLATYSYLTGATWVNANYRAAARLPFQYNSAGTDRFNGDNVQKQDVFLQDIILGLQNYNLMYLPLDIGVYWEGRAYLPTSKNSKNAGLITRFRNNFIFNRAFTTNFMLEYDQKFSYYVQSRSAYQLTIQDQDGYDREITTTTKNMEIEHNLRAWYRLTPQTAFGWMFGQHEEYWNKSDAENRAKPGERKLVTGPQFKFPITNNANFIFTYQDYVNRDDEESRQELGKFLPKNAQFALLSFIKF